MYQDLGKCISLPAAADLSALQYTAIEVSATGAASATDAAAPIIGILQNKPEAGQAAEVAVSGIAKAEAGAGGWTAGQKLTATTGGVLIATTTDTNHYVGVAMATVAAGDAGPVLIQPGMVAG